MAKMLRMTEEEYAKRHVAKPSGVPTPKPSSPDQPAFLVAKVSAGGKVGKFRTINKSRPSKYKNVKTEVGGIKFDSKREASRYSHLKLEEMAGSISDLKTQVKFDLVPSQKDAQGKTERGVAYWADFTYLKAGKLVVEDAKGVRTAIYKIKRKLMMQVHGITIVEV